MAIRDYNPRPFSENQDPSPTASDAKSIEKRIKLKVWTKNQREIIRQAVAAEAYSMAVRILGNARIGRECYGNGLHTIRATEIEHDVWAQECQATAKFWDDWSRDQRKMEALGWQVIGRKPTVRLLTSLEQILRYEETLELIEFRARE